MMSSGDARFFSSTKKGEIAEWRAELNNPDKDVKKDAVKKCTAAMTVREDMPLNPRL
jgi:AP-1 complex subunit beta-1